MTSRRRPARTGAASDSRSAARAEAQAATAPDLAGSEPPPPGQASLGLEGLESSGLAVFANRPFLLLWLSQAATQIGGNMVIYGLTVIIYSATFSSAAVSLLLLTFLVPAVIFSAVAGVYVDRIDRRLILVVTNVLRAAAFGVLFLAGDNLLAIYLLNVLVSTLTTFFAPAELAMIPKVVPRAQLIAANGIFTFTLNAAFALGFALLGPLVVNLAGASALLLFVAALYLVAAGFCATLPAAPPTGAPALSPFQAVSDAEKAVEDTIAQLRAGLAYIRTHRDISWSLIYLGITASLVGVLGVLGPDFATKALGLDPEDFVVVVLPLGFGIVTGILLLNNYGRRLPRRRVIETGLVSLGVLLAILSVAGPLTFFLQRADAGGVLDLRSLVSLLSVVVAIAFMAGIAYATVAIPAQTQLQEDLPEDVRGRVFGVLNMLVSIASFLPIIIVGPIADIIGTPAVIFAVAILVAFSGISSVLRRGVTPRAPAMEPHEPTPYDPMTVAIGAPDVHRYEREIEDPGQARGPWLEERAEPGDDAPSRPGRDRPSEPAPGPAAERAADPDETPTVVDLDLAGGAGADADARADEGRDRR